jgi:hypothetical protein
MYYAVYSELYHITNKAPVFVTPAPNGSFYRRVDNRDISYLIK